jgi:hypothetical protein
VAYQAIKGGLWIPRPFDWDMPGANPAYSSMLIDASTEKAAYVFRAPKTGTLDKFEWRAGAVSINASSVIRCSFQDVGAADGNPDGTQDQYRDVSGASITANTWIVPGLLTNNGADGGTKRSVTIGDMLAIVIEYQTFTAADSVAVSTVNSPGQYIGSPYSDHYTGTWAHQYAASGGVFALKYDDGTYEHVLGAVYPASALNGPSFNSGSTPDERGLKFKLPVPFKLRGCYFRAGLFANCDIVLYDSDGSTPLATVTHDGDYQGFSSSYAQQNYVTFPSEVTGAKDTYYRLVVKPTSVSNVILYDFEVSAAAIMDAIEGGQNFHYTQRTDAGAWTDTTTKRPFISLLVSAADDGAGGGGTAGGLLIGGNLVQ